MIETDAAQAQRRLSLRPRFSDDLDWLGAIECCTGPRGVLPAQSDIDATRKMTLGIRDKANEFLP